MSTEESTKMDGTVYSKMVGFPMNPRECRGGDCFDIYRFGGCLGADGPATDQVFWGFVFFENNGNPPTVSWEEMPPLEVRKPWLPPEEHYKVPVAAHTAVRYGTTDVAWLLGGLDNCGSKPDGSPTVFHRWLWQWRRDTGSLLPLILIPEDCGIAYHSANYWNDEGNPGMLVYGGMRSSSCGGSIFLKNAWWFSWRRVDFLLRLGRRTRVSHSG